MALDGELGQAVREMHGYFSDQIAPLLAADSVVEAHGGRIWMEDPPGGGAAFVFALPSD